MKAILVDGRGGIEVMDRPVPTLGAGEILVAPAATGVCGTDLHLIEGSYVHGRYPVVPGHEFAGYVVAAGAGVTRLREGDFVGIDPNISCGHCRWCRSGAKNLCPDLMPIGISVDGSCAEYVAVPEQVCYRLPETLDPSSAALIEPLSCVLHAVERSPIAEGARAAVFGAGTIGLMVVAVLKQLGAGPVAVLEPHEIRRDLATQMGADVAVPDVSGLDNFGDVDVAVDASGNPAAIQSAIEILGRRGRLVQMGVANEDARIALSPYDVFAKELSIVGSNSLATSYQAAVDMMVDMAATLRPLVTDQLPLSEYPEAVRRASSPAAVKVQLVPD
jgi:2-desacetyl-2-hydroxyethyl bacteriochlorophyllide A dehydrogenase